MSSVGDRDGAERDASRGDDLVELSLTNLQEHTQRSPLSLPMKSPKQLPLHELEPEVFERLVAELVVNVTGSPSVHFYGRRGQQQHGLDIFEEQPGGTRVLYQVKRYTTITPALIRDAVHDYAGPPRPIGHQLPARRFDPKRFTLVTSAAVDHDTAKVEEVAALQQEYRHDLEIAVWGAEMVSRLLRQHSVLVAAVFGEAWAGEYCGQSNLKKGRKEAERRQRISDALAATMATQYVRDNEIRFRQVELTGPSVDSLFVDVPASSQPGTAAGELLARISHVVHDRASQPEQADGYAGAAQALLHPDWSSSVVLIGGPGQGKTTLLQYICQFHRARAQGRDEYSPIAAGLNSITSIVRTPVRLDLPQFAEWRRERLAGQRDSGRGGGRRGPSNGQPDQATLLEFYLADLIQRTSGHPFAVRDLYTAAAERPMLIALDGLDEVADAGERQIVADEIREAHARLRGHAADLLILVATRPGAVERPLWRDPQFAALYLHQLTAPLRMQYLDRWTAQSRLTPEEVAELRATFTANITEPHVSELAGNPMQLAILLHLMQRRSVLPEKRTELYDRYIDVFFDREAKNPAIAQHKHVVIEFHKLLAWRIHTKMERGDSSGAVSLGELERVLAGHLEPRGLDPATIADLFTAVTTRVVCLVQRDLDAHEFQFEVQPLREYFAASYLYDTSPSNGPKNTRAACLAELLKRPFWSNVARFYAGRFTSGEIPSIPYALREIQKDASVGAHPLSRVAAKQMLDDHVLVGQTELMIRDLIGVIFIGSGPVLAVDGLLEQSEALPHFGPTSGAKQATDFLTDRLREPPTPDVASAIATLLVELTGAAGARQRWWEQITRVDPAAWLPTAAALGLLNDPQPDRVQAVDRLLATLDPDVEILPLLVSTDATVLSDARVRRCIDELRRGLGGRVGEGRDPSNPYQRLSTTATAGPLYASLTAKSPTETPDAGPAKRRRRIRRRAELAAWSEHVARLESATIEHRRQPNRGSWCALLDTVDSVWGGDCWPMREALLAHPADLTQAEAELAVIAESSPWRQVARWLGEARDRRNDLGWWTAQAQVCTDELASMTFVVAALVFATNETVRQLTAQLNNHTGRLSTARWATATAALQRYARHHPAARLLMLEDPLRTNRMKPDGRLAVLTWHVAGQPTRNQLYRPIAASLPSVWGGGESTSLVLRDFASHYTGTLAVDHLVGGRRDLPPGALEDTKLKQMTYGSSQRILNHPSRWPTDVVRRAAERLSQRLTGQPPIAEIASSHNWLGPTY